MERRRIVGGRVLHHTRSNGRAIFLARDVENGTSLKVFGTVDRSPLNAEMTIYGDVREADTGAEVGFDAIRITPDPDMDEGTLSRAIAARRIAGIGEREAIGIARAFGSRAFYMMEAHPDRVAESVGLDAETAAAMRTAMEDASAMRPVAHLERLQIPKAHHRKILEALGPAGVARLSTDPVALSRVHGLPFSVVTATLTRAGATRGDIRMQKAALSAALVQGDRNGACGVELETVKNRAAELLKPLPPSLDAAISEMRGKKEMIVTRKGGAQRAYSAATFLRERRIAGFLARGRSPSWTSFDVHRAIDRFEAENSVTLANRQRDAVDLAARGGIGVLTGGPGTGKTTTLKCILDTLSRHGVSIRQAALTGTAAERMRAATGRLSSTVHSMLISPDGEPHHGGNPIPADMVVIDEASMMDNELFDRVIAALRLDASLLLVGDVDQIPSIGEGRVLAETIDSGVVPVTELDVVYRQKAGSGIISAASDIREGKAPLGAKGDAFRFMDCEKSEEIRESIVRMMTVDFPKHTQLDPVRDVVVLCPTKDGDCGVNAFNERLRAHFNPSSPGKVEIEVKRLRDDPTATLREGDRVMYRRNDKRTGLANGDVGLITRIDADARTATGDFNGRRVELQPEDLPWVNTAYAITFHKSQGAEFPVVLMPFPRTKSTFLQRNLVYTAVTRGKKYVRVVGDYESWDRAVRRTSNTERHSLVGDLARRLAQPAPEATDMTPSAA